MVNNYWIIALTFLSVVQLYFTEKFEKGNDDRLLSDNPGVKKRGEDFNWFKTIEFVVNSQKEMCEMKTARLEEKLRQQERKLEKHESKIDDIKSVLKNLEVVISSKKIARITKNQDRLQLKNKTLIDKLASQEKRLDLYDKNQIKIKLNQDKIMSDISSLEKRLSVPVKRPIVAFSAFAHSQSNVDPGATIKFLEVRSNEGNAFNRLTSVFTAPFSGSYVFMCSILTKCGSALEVFLKVNDTYKMLVYPDARKANWNHAMNAVILNLKKGDRVWMEKNKNYGQRPFYVHWGFSTFSGFFIG
ncbi:uncharacterized protein [Mytilus edulis]|uniref:uncharacterized protein n=1 Tax=Mytilus edulis TaxID=6550 RepID=UPI0039EF516F